jgi:MFS family permease
MMAIDLPTVERMPIATARSRAMPALFAGAAMMNAAMAAASAVSTIVAADELGPAWGAVPNTAGIVGTGIGALALTRVMNRWGRRAGLILGYVVAAAGAAIAATAVAAGDGVLPPVVPPDGDLTFGMLLLGLGNAGAQLSRYAAAELYPAGRRGFAIGVVIWAGTIGAVGGPLLLAPSSRIVVGLGGAAFVGPFAFAALAGAVAVVAVSGMPAGTGRVGGSRLPGGSPVPGGSRLPGGSRVPGWRVPLRALLGTHAARSALAVMATAQVVMVAVMTAAPVDMHLHGHGLGAVGTVLSAHTLGMFALSPLTGRLLDRFGSQPVMLGGLLTLAVAAGLAATMSQPSSRMVALFLLGYGWNLCFIGGSGRLARELPESERAHVEGTVDAAIWTIAAVGSLASTVVLSAGGYPILAAAAGALTVIPAVLLSGRHRLSGRNRQAVTAAE